MPTYRKYCFIVCILLAQMALGGCHYLGITEIPRQEVKEKYANKNSRFLEYGDTTIHYRDEGGGPVLILIHGVCASLHTWNGWVEELKDDFRIIRLDLPGFGLTPLSDISHISRTGAVQLLDEMTETLGVDHFHLAGNSLGGDVAWTYAYAHPEKVDRLILIAPAGYPMDSPWLLNFATYPLIRPISRHIMPRFIFNMALEQVYGDESRITDAVRDRYFELAMREGGKDDYVDIFSALKKRLKSPTADDGIDDLQGPLMLMWGEKDIWIPYEKYFPRWQDDYPRATFVTYPGAGHIPMEELPLITARHARQFLSGDLPAERISVESRTLQ